MNPTQQEIEEGNAIIAEAMGGKIIKYTVGDTEVYYDKFPDSSFNHQCSVKLLRYHTSWDWLMPVVIHISNAQSVFRIIVGNMGTVCLIDTAQIPIQDRSHPEPILAVWHTCVEYFKWKKEQQKQNG